MRDFPGAEATSSEECASPRPRSVWWEYVEALLLALLFAVLIRGVVVQAFKIPSGSMLPTLQVGDQILVDKLAYGLRVPGLGQWLWQGRAPARGDIVVFVYPVDPEKDFIKRVIGVAGDVVQVRNKVVYINGKKTDDPHAYFADGDGRRQSSEPRDDFGPVAVPAGQLFVMGDNRDRSYDSRFWGFVDRNDVRGRAFLVYWSWDRKGRWVRWERIGRWIE